LKHARFVHLHVHTDYSPLDGACKVKEILKKAAEFRMPALAITDHGNLFGVIKFYKEAHKIGIKPIIGMEAYITKQDLHKKPRGNKSDYNHLTLLASNEEGYRNLMKLSSISHLEGFYYRPRIDKKVLGECHKGLIGMSACLKGEIPQALIGDDYEAAKKVALFYKDLFGSQNFYLELIRIGLEQSDKANEGLIKLSKDIGISLVATNDVHYPMREDSEAHDVLLALQTKDSLQNKDRFKFESRELYFKSPEEMKEIFQDIPEAVENTIKIAERCNVDLKLEEKRIQLPKFELPKGYTSPYEYLSHLARKGLKRRVSTITPGIEEKLNYELNVIKDMGLCAYFLIIEDLIGFARHRKIRIGPGRGSAVGSLVLYSLGITNINPIEFGLLFERFLNPERVTMPDVDIDFCDRKREEVITYLLKKYGRDSVAQIITFNTLGAKGVLRDVGRVLGFPYDEVDKIAKLVPNALQITIDDAMRDNQFKKHIEAKKEYEKLISIAKRLEGLNRHPSIHASGVVITPGTLTDFVPLYKKSGEGSRVATQYDMKSVEEVGLLKIDILGLRTLSVIDDTLDLLSEKNVAVDIEKVPLDDKETYAMLQKGDTSGVFQLESSGMRKVVIDISPDKFSDIIASVALFRPGPIKYIEEFIQKKKGKSEVTFPHPLLENILKDTYGIMIYQEQVMQTASIIANFTLGEADVLRRAMGKKMLDEMDAKRQDFVEGAKKNHVNVRTAEKIFSIMIPFAGYGFNKSHAAGYAMLAYQTAYLKVHYPVEFLSATLSSVMDNSKKIRFFAEDCKKHGIEVSPPSINTSFAKFKPVNGKICFGLSAIKNVGEKAAVEIVKEREKSGIYKGLYDFVSRLNSDIVNKKAIEGLVKGGAFDCIETSRAKLVASIEKAIKAMSSLRKERASGQGNLFDSGNKSSVEEKLVNVKDWSKIRVLLNENEALGLYFSGHPYENYYDEVKSFTMYSSKNLGLVEDREEVVCGGVIEEKRKTKDKKGEDMAFLTLADLDGYFDAVVFSSLFKKCWQDLRIGNTVIIKGQKSTNTGKKERESIVASKILTVEDLRKSFIKRIEFHLPYGFLDEEISFAIKEIVASHPGKKDFYLCVNSGKRVTRLKLESKVEISKKLIESLKEINSNCHIKIGGKHI